MPIFAWNVPLISLIFLKRSLVFPILLFSSISLLTFLAHWEGLSYLSLLFFGTLHSNGYIFPFLLCFSLLFFSQLFVRPPQMCFHLHVPILLLWYLPPKQSGSHTHTHKSTSLIVKTLADCSGHIADGRGFWDGRIYWWGVECWKRTRRDCKLDPGNRRHPTLSPVLGMCVLLAFPSPEAAQGHNLERGRWDHLDGICDWAMLSSIYI